MSKNCEKPPKCYFCGQNTHHSSLCFSKFGSSGHKESSGSKGLPKSAGILGANVTGPTTLDPSTPPFRPNPQSAGPTSFQGVANSSDKPGFVQMQMASVKLGTVQSPIRIFFDCGCSRSYITSSLTNFMGLKAVGKELISNGRFEDKQRRTHSYPRVELSLPTLESPVHLSLLVTETIACPITRVPIDMQRYPILQRVALADPPPKSPENVSIDILVGLDHYYQLIGGERIDLPGGLVLLGSKLGYITAGPVPETQAGDSVQPSYLAALFSGASSVSFQNADLERFWSLEDIGIKDDSYAKDDELALRRFNDSIRYDGSRYEVGWPWKSDNPELPSNYDLAHGRLISLMKRLHKEPELLSVYDKTIKTQLDSKIIEEVTDHSAENSRVHYLPHHCVVKPDRATTKVRIVYDGSAKSTRSSSSLNDCLLRGPVFLRDLCGLLLSFRIPQFAVTADIEKAFLQISIRATDRDVTRFLWLKDINAPVSPANLVVYRFCRVLFGIISSPFLLDATIKHFLHQTEGPLTKAIADGLYVDNVICGASTEDECTQLYTGAKKIFADNGMNIREWNFNSNLLMKFIPEADQNKSNPYKVLGLFWDPKADTISCGAKLPIPSDVCTKRHLTQAASKIFDPCGFLSPVVLQAKILIQETWARKIKWDQPLPSDLCDRWLAISQSLNSVSQLSVPRFIGHLLATQWSIHCFCDASCKVYTGVVYVQAGPGIPPVIVFSKTKLAPLKPVSMPRLELMAVVVGCRITSFVVKHLSLTSAAVTVWSDSKCVLQWLQSNKVLSVFVENRVKEIRSFEFAVRYVPTQLNSADICSRGCTFIELVDSSLWWHGPDFLCQSESSWPITDLGKEVPPDTRATEETSLAGSADLSTPTDSFIDVKKFSTLRRLLRVTAWVLRFTSLLRRHVSDAKISAPAVTGPRLSCSDLTFAEHFWVSKVQSQTLTPTSRDFSNTKNFQQQLGVFVGDDGLYRCSGRIQYSNLSDEAKFPILLPKQHHFTRLVIMDVHVRNTHASRAHTLAILRQRYWVPHGRSVVKSVLHDCLICRRFEGRPFAVPPFPPLPEFRVQAAQPFLNVGVDYFGPLYIRQGADSSKVWVCLFTCAATRAVHLEVVTDLCTDQFLLALRRFVSLYATPHIIVSDNAKHFKLAQDVLHRLWAEIVNSEKVQEFCATRGIQWVFIPEYAPWMGGFYERLVGTVKRSLKKALGRQMLDLVQLQTIIAEICSIVNTRPMIAPDDDISPILTPADLLGKSKGFSVKQSKTHEFLEFDAPDNPDETVRFGPAKSSDVLKKWKQTRKLVDQFWQMWSSEYLTSLREGKSRHNTRNTDASLPKVGTVVIIKSSLPRSVWSLGKIQKLHSSSDGEIRSATVLLPNKKTVVRPIKLLYPIESNLTDYESEMSRDKAKHKSVDSTSSQERRPLRQAARLARQKFADQLQDNADSDTALCCFISGSTTMDADVQARLELTNNACPLSYLHSQPAFMIGSRSCTSMQMGVWCLILICHSREDLADALVNHPGLRQNPAGISSWLEQIGFRNVANVNCILNLDRLHYAVAKCILDTPNNKILPEFRRCRETYGDAPFNFVYCAKKEFVYSCGFSVKHPTIQDPDTWPGFNVHGDTLDTLYAGWAHDYVRVQSPTVDSILANPGLFGNRYSRAALIISDSLSRHLRSVEYSSITRVTGATFADLARRVKASELQSAKYVVILAGTNMTTNAWNEERWRQDWRKMFQALEPVMYQGSDTRILVNGPIWNTDPRAVKVGDFSQWFANKAKDIDNITFFDWSNPDGNPFVTTKKGQLRVDSKYYDRDHFHVNPKGYLLFWRRWCYTFRDLQVLTTKYDAEIWQSLNRPHVPHSKNNRITA